jgi:hypothetical protein
MADRHGFGLTRRVVRGRSGRPALADRSGARQRFSPAGRPQHDGLSTNARRPFRRTRK